MFIDWNNNGEFDASDLAVTLAVLEDEEEDENENNDDVDDDDE